MTKPQARTNKTSELSPQEFNHLCRQYRRYAEERDYRTRKSKLYFNQNDEFQLEDFLPELIQSKQCGYDCDTDEEDERHQTV